MLLVLLAGLVVLAACGGDDRQPSSVTWRNITLDVPDGWYVFEETDTRLSLSNADIGPEAIRGGDDVPEGDIVAMFFTYEPGVVPDDWRRFVEQQEGDLELDDAITLGEGTPATRLVFRYDTAGIPMREMVTVVPSRDVVVLSQPVPRQGQTDGPDVFLRHRERMDAVLDSARVGAPVTD